MLFLLSLFWAHPHAVATNSSEIIKVIFNLFIIVIAGWLIVAVVIVFIVAPYFVPYFVELLFCQLFANVEELVEFKEGVAEIVAHQIGAFHGEVDVVASRQAAFVPSHHGVVSTHGVIYAPE